jgi:hypothetical protein
MKNWMISISAAVLAACMAPAMAQTGTGQGAQAGNVSVDISAVKADIAKNLNIDESKLPGTVQLPAGAAAAVCGVGAETLAPAGQSASCKATMTNAALEQAIKAGIK